MRIAITGHRPEDCEDEETVRRKLRVGLGSATNLRSVIVGMAAGVDLWAGDEALDMGFPVIAARPWKTHAPRVQDRELYERVLRDAALVVVVCDVEQYPGPWVYHHRNEWMVNHATHVLTYYNGKKKGGTYSCLEYAKNLDVPIRNVY